MNDKIAEFITSDLIRTANELSHDSGKVFELDEIQHFLNQIKDIQFYIENQLQNRRQKIHRNYEHRITIYSRCGHSSLARHTPDTQHTLSREYNNVIGNNM